MIDSEVNRRLINITEYLGFSVNDKLSKSAFARYVGVHPSTIGEITLSRKGLGVSVLVGLALKNPEINIGWLLTGNGSMILGGEITQTIHAVEKCRECERKLLRIELLREDIAEYKKENNELRNEIAILRNKLNT